MKSGRTKSIISMVCLNSRFYLILIFLVFGLVVQKSHAQTYTLLHSFSGQPDGGNPIGTVFTDRNDNIYGVTSEGGNTYPYLGTIFEATTNGSEHTLVSFGGSVGDPISSLVRDAKGDVYGSGAYGDGGLIYEATGNEIQVIYIFTGGDHEEWFPSGNIVRDDVGNIYGVTEGGGHSSSFFCRDMGGCGIVFQVTPAGKATILHNFLGGTDGAQPHGGLTLAPNGEIYGTTDLGGINSNSRTYGNGGIFKIDKAGKFSNVFRFNGKDGAVPYAPLIFDSDGNAYGTTAYGGVYGYGTAFEINSAGKEKVLYNFGSGNDGRSPYGGLVRDPKGNFYGTTTLGGSYNWGTVFMLSPGGVEQILYSFTGKSDSGYPISGLAIDSKGNLVGATFSGGIFDGECTELGGDIGCGTLFKITP